MNPQETAIAIARDIERLPDAGTEPVRTVRRRWSATLRPCSGPEVLAIARAVEAQAGQGAKWVAYELIRFHPAAFATVSQAQVADYAGRLASWYAVDAFGTILAGPLWARGQLPDSLAAAWSFSEDRWLRRLALVVTVGLNGRSGAGDAGRTLALCRRLAADPDDMVQKALSWSLRELSKRDRAAVESFLAELGQQLPARVRREVANKLATGLKTPRKPREVTAD